MDYETIITDERDSIFIITFNRLEAKNAINNQMQEDLAMHLTIGIKTTPCAFVFSPTKEMFFALDLT